MINQIISYWRKDLQRVLFFYESKRSHGDSFFLYLFIFFVFLNIACYWFAMVTAFPSLVFGKTFGYYFKVQFPVGILGALFDSLSFFVTIFIVRRALLTVSTKIYIAHLSIDLVIAVLATFWVILVFIVSGWTVSFIETLGQSEEFVEGWISSSIYQEIIINEFDGAPPPINLANEKKVIDIILTLNEERLLTAAHDISDGGLLPTICEMLFKNNLGMDLNLPDLLSKKDSKDILLHSWCFGEDQGRVIVATKNLNKVKLLLKKYNIKFFILGEVNSSSNLNIKNVTTISINDIKNLYENTLTSIMC